MIDKRVGSTAEAVADIFDGATVMIGGFASAGSPIELIHALVNHGARDLLVINNNTGSGHVGMASLIAAGQVRKVITSYPRTAKSVVFPEMFRAGKVGLEMVPQGTLAERIRAGGAGIPAFYTATAVGTPLAEGKETREFGGRTYVMEEALKADFALIKCGGADRYGNLLYNKTARNFGPIMATAAEVTIAQAESVAEVGSIDPEAVVTPGIFVDRVVHIPNPAQETRLIEEGRRYP